MKILGLLFLCFSLEAMAQKYRAPEFKLKTRPKVGTVFQAEDLDQSYDYKISGENDLSQRQVASEEDQSSSQEGHTPAVSDDENFQAPQYREKVKGPGQQRPRLKRWKMNVR